MSLEILYNFTFSNGKIFEVKFKDLLETAEKKDRFQWYLIYNNKRLDLKFEKIENNKRYFTYQIVDGVKYGAVGIILDIDNQILHIYNNSYKLEQI